MLDTACTPIADAEVDVFASDAFRHRVGSLEMPFRITIDRRSLLWCVVLPTPLDNGQYATRVLGRLLQDGRDVRFAHQWTSRDP
jgi:hypothetical protein